MSPGARLPAALAAGLALLSLAFLNGRVMVLALPLLVYLGAGMLSRPRNPRLAAERVLRAERTAEDAPVAVVVTVRNEGPSLAEVLLADRIPPSLAVSEGHPSLLASLPAGASATWTYAVRGRRGGHSWDGVLAEARGHCGPEAAPELLSADSSLFVLPGSWALPRVSIRPRQTRGFAGPIHARTAGCGVLGFGVREYRLGDPLRRVNWRLSSRDPRTLYVNEYEQERIADVGIVLDARSTSYRRPAGGPVFEAAVSAAMSLAERFLADGNRVALLVYGHSLDRVPPGSGRMQAEKIRRRLAAARPGANFAMESLSHLPTRLFPVRSQLVFLSPLQAGDARVLRALRGLGYSLLVVSPDPESAAESGAASPSGTAVRLARLERRLVVAALRRAGAGVVDWRLDGDAAAALRAALARRNAEPWAEARP